MKFKVIKLVVGLIFVTNFTFAQTENVKVFMNPSETNIVINKELIKVEKNTFQSKYYNFYIKVPEVIRTIETSGLDNNCIFEIANNYYSHSFWVNQFKKTIYTKKYCEAMFKNLNEFKKFYRENLPKTSLANGKIINDEIRVIHFDSIPGIQYKCNFTTFYDNKPFNGQIIITQVFYLHFNYRLISVCDLKSGKKETSDYLNSLLLSSFKLLTVHDK